MRTTLAIDDELLERARLLAQEQGTTVGKVVENALRRDFARAAPARGPQIPTFRGGSGPRPGINLDSTRDLMEFLDEGRSLDSLR
jgi:hypothetical protein